jgi:cell division septation protein DedD
MSRSYYVIELSARWLTVLLVALALLMVLAFGLGYGAARSVMGEGDPGNGAPTPTPEITEQVIPSPTGSPAAPTGPIATPTPRRASPTIAPPTRPPATATPTPSPTPDEGESGGFWVQVLASSREASIDDAKTKVEGLGFGRDNQRVVRSDVVGGNQLLKLRVGPFPDRDSADRVLKRLRAAGFPDAWVVVP